MGRPERKNVDYFPHFFNHGPKMNYLIRKYGAIGYTVWYRLMERLSASENHHIDLSDEIQLTFLADYCLTDEKTLLDIFNFLSRAKWLHKKLWDEYKIVCSAEFIESIAPAYERRKNECINIHGIEFMYYNKTQATELIGDKNTQTRLDYTREDYIVEEWDKKFVQFAKEMMSDITWQEVIRRQRDKLRKKDNMRAAIEHFISHCHLNKHTHEKIDDFKNHFQNFILTDAYFKIEFN